MSMRMAWSPREVNEDLPVLAIMWFRCKIPDDRKSGITHCTADVVEEPVEAHATDIKIEGVFSHTEGLESDIEDVVCYRVSWLHLNSRAHLFLGLPVLGR